MTELHLDLNRLKAERVANNLTQDKLAQHLNKKREWYAKRENGFVKIGADELAAIATILKVNDLSIFFKKVVPEKQL